jgi:hypothetical protein
VTVNANITITLIFSSGCSFGVLSSCHPVWIVLESAVERREISLSYNQRFALWRVQSFRGNFTGNNMNTFIGIMVLIIIFLMGVVTGACLNHWHDRQEIEKIKNNVPECSEPKELYYL